MFLFFYYFLFYLLRSELILFSFLVDIFSSILSCRKYYIISFTIYLFYNRENNFRLLAFYFILLYYIYIFFLLLLFFFLSIICHIHNTKLNSIYMGFHPEKKSNKISFNLNLILYIMIYHYKNSSNLNLIKYVYHSKISSNLNLN